MVTGRTGPVRVVQSWGNPSGDQEVINGQIGGGGETRTRANVIAAVTRTSWVGSWAEGEKCL